MQIVELLQEQLSDSDAGLQSLFDKWNSDDYTWTLKFSKDDELLAVFTDNNTSVIEVLKLRFELVI